MKTLDYSLNGDNRFSVAFAKIEVGNKLDTILNHYQSSKRFRMKEGVSLTLEEAMAEEIDIEKPKYFVLEGRKYEPKYLKSFYSTLLVKYLDKNPSLVEYAKEYDSFVVSKDDFYDTSFGKGFKDIHSDIINKYVKDGRLAVLKECQEFIKLMKQPHCVREIEGNLLTSDMDIFGHQTNCKGVMGAGIAYHIKKMYPKVFDEYKKLCDRHYNGQGLLGKCQLVSETGKVIERRSIIAFSDGQVIANLFGQNTFGNGVETMYEHLKTALVELKMLAKEHDLWVGIPYKIGCNLAGGDWNIVRGLIIEVFNDYPVTIFKLPGVE